MLVGEPGVGKTSLVRRFVDHSFDDKYISSIGVTVKSKEVEVTGGNGRTEPLNLLIYDLQGEHQGKREPPYDSYMRGAQGVMAVFDLAAPETAGAITGFWVPRVRKVAGPVPIFIVGNKHDLKPNAFVGSVLAPVLSGLQGEAFSGSLASAKTGEAVEAAFKKLGGMVLGAMP
jgi:small GTP-binding protein